MTDHADFKTFAESLGTPELARRIYANEDACLQNESLIAEKQRLVAAERVNIETMKAVIADRNEREDHLPLWNSFDGRRRPLSERKGKD